MYMFDAVVTNKLRPLFNGTTEETVEWLKKNETQDTDLVCVGDTMDLVSIEQYLARVKA